MKSAKITVKKMVIPTYVNSPREDLPIFCETRNHQNTTGQVYPNKVIVEGATDKKVNQEWTAVHLENDYIDVIVLPEIGGRIFQAKDKSNNYDYFYRQHVIKRAPIGILGSWISGGVEFNWPFHHRASGFHPLDYDIEKCEDGSVICWLSEHDPFLRIRQMLGIVVRPDSTTIETRAKIINRTAARHSFHWWENAAVSINESYQFFFPKDVTYVNYHNLLSRATFPITGDTVFNGIPIDEGTDISWLKNSPDATSYFACESKYDFFGGYDHGKEAGVVHIADHNVSPGKKMFTWGLRQLSQTWENSLTDEDGPYCELMAGSYTDNQPDFTWIEPYETKEFSEYWYPIKKIGTPHFANLNAAVRFDTDTLNIDATKNFGKVRITVSANGKKAFEKQADLFVNKPLKLSWKKPKGLLTIYIVDSKGNEVLHYVEEEADELKMLPPRGDMPYAVEETDVERLYLAGVHMEQYRAILVRPDAYWLEALKRDPHHTKSLVAMARFRLKELRLVEAKRYIEKALKILTEFNERLEDGEPYFIYAEILEALGDFEKAHDYYYKAAWSTQVQPKATTRLAMLDLKFGDTKAALEHSEWALKHDALNPIIPAVKMLADPANSKKVASEVLKNDSLNLLVKYLSGNKNFYKDLHAEAAQSVLDLTYDLYDMGQVKEAIKLLEGLVRERKDQDVAMIRFTLAFLKAKLGKDFKADLKAAENLSTGLSFPHRRHEADVLEFAINNGSKVANYYLGCLLYDKRHYKEAGELFETYVKECPKDFKGYRVLSIAQFSHLDKRDEALANMKKALKLSNEPFLVYDAMVLMNKLGVDPKEKLKVLGTDPKKIKRENLIIELAKCYNQLGQPEKALDILLSKVFKSAEGGETFIAAPYMYANLLIGTDLFEKGKYEEAQKAFENAMNIPKSLGTGYWNRFSRIPYEYAVARCLDKRGLKKEAEEAYESILNVQMETSSKGALPELKYYQARCAAHLGLLNKAQNMMIEVRRKWREGLEVVDEGYFAPTPFFESFVRPASEEREAQFTFLLGLVELFDNHPAKAKEFFTKASKMNSDNNFARYYAKYGAVLEK